VPRTTRENADRSVLPACAACKAPPPPVGVGAASAGQKPMSQSAEDTLVTSRCIMPCTTPAMPLGAGMHGNSACHWCGIIRLAAYPRHGVCLQTRKTTRTPRRSKWRACHERARSPGQGQGRSRRWCSGFSGCGCRAAEAERGGDCACGAGRHDQRTCERRQQVRSCRRKGDRRAAQAEG